MKFRHVSLTARWGRRRRATRKVAHTRLARQQIPERGGGRGATAGGHARTGEQEPTRLAFDDVRHA